MSSHPLTNFEIQECYQNQPRFNGVFSRDNLPNKIKDETYVINLDEYSDIGTGWVALYVKNIDVTYFDSFGVDHIPNEIKAFIDRTSSSASHHKNLMVKIFKIQTYESIMRGYFCIEFSDHENIHSVNSFVFNN